MIRNFKRLVGLYLLVAGSIVPLSGQAQSGASQGALSKLTVSSPTASGLAKFTDFPTSSYSGTPDISIPLYTIKTSFAELPITLSYHAGGVKVNQNAGSSGLGWNIVAGGVINRSVLGLADNGSWQQYGLNWVSQPINYSNDTVYQNMQSLGNNFIDGVPDLYTYNMNGNSGKFIIADSIRQLPQTSNQITKVSANEFQIITPDGIKYVFNAIETSFNKTATSATTSTVAWYLTKMVSADQLDSILFSYKSTSYEMESGRNFSVSLVQNSAGFYGASGSSTNDSYFSRINGKELSRIDFRHGSIDFNLTWNTRQDLNAVDSAALVDAIVVKNSLGNTIRRIGFRYDYFNNASSDNSYKRLRLIGAYIHPGSGTDTLLAERYGFFYNSTALPAKTNLGIDHWGYYNGKSNSTLIPTWTNCSDQYTPPNCLLCSNSTYTYTFNGANREPDAAYMMAGMLERISLPTGGQKVFEWEPHQVSNPDSGKPVYANSQVTDAFVAATSSSFVTDSSADFYVDPAIYPNGLCANFFGAMVFSEEDPAIIDHAGGTSKLYRRSGRMLIESFAFSSGAGFSGSEAVVLQPGQSYFIEVRIRQVGFSCSGGLTAYTVSSYLPKNILVGGARIKRITLYDHITNTATVNRYEYTLSDNSTVSSGQLAHQPTYATQSTTFERVSECNYVNRASVLLSSNSFYNIGAGSHVGYSDVKESRGNGNAGGYSWSHFTNDFGESFAGDFDASWRRGQLVSRSDYSAAGVLLKKTFNRYTYDTRGFKHYQGRQTTTYALHPCANPNNYDDAYPLYTSIKGYYFPSEWCYVDSTAVTIYDMADPTKFKTNIQLTYFDNATHKLTTRTLSTDSKGWKVRTTFKYPLDYTLPGGTLTGEQRALQLLQQRNQNTVIEQYVQKYDPASPSTVYTVSGMFNTYKTLTVPNGTHPVMDVQYDLQAPVTLTSFTPSAISGSTISKDSHYNLAQQAVNYDNILNITELEKPGDEVSSYIWDYKGEYLIAKAENATQNQIAYTSFEGEGKGNWSFVGTPSVNANAPTGGKVFQPSGTTAINRVGMNASETYILSYWTDRSTPFPIGGTQVGARKGATTASGWTYYEHTVTGVTAVSLNSTGLVDELKLYPAKAQMATYTYTPLMGVTSACSNGDVIVKYNYDAAGRLISTTDRDGNLLKVYDYQYQVPMLQ